VTALAKLPALLERIDTLESGTTLCRRRHCYAEAFSWLPYCVIHQEPAPFRFFQPSGFSLSRFALQAEFRLGYGLGLAAPSSLSSFVRISSAC
jgi:hypothetical protein